MNRRVLDRCIAAGPLLAVLFLAQFLVIEKLLAQLPTAELRSLSPFAGQVGESLQVTVAGTHLDEADRLLFGQGKITSKANYLPLLPLEKSPRLGNGFSVDIAADAGPGISEVRVATRFGISNPRRFLITQKPIQNTIADQANFATPTILAKDHIVLGTCRAQSKNYYSLTLGQEESFRITAYDKVLHSRADLVVSLLNASGDELIRSASIGSWPAELEFTASVAGDYLIAVQDLLFRGGNEYGYVLESSTSMPPATSEDSSNPPVTLLECELDRYLRPTLRNAIENPLLRDVSAARGSTMDASTFKAIDLNLTQTSEDPLPIPVTTVGHLLGGISEHRFLATAGEDLWFEVSSSKLSQLTDIRAFIFPVNEQTGQPDYNRKLAENDDALSTGSPDMRLIDHDPYFVWKAPEDGLYQLVLQDLETSKSRPAESTKYILEIRKAEPEFKLLAYRPFATNNPATARPHGTQLNAGDTEAINVLVLRRDGFNAPISLTVDNLPAGIECPPVMVHPTEQAKSLVLTSSPNGEVSDWTGNLRIVGKADSMPEPVYAHCATIVWPTMPTRNQIVSSLTQQLKLATSSLGQTPFAIRIGNETTESGENASEPVSVLEAQQGGKVSIPVRLTRTEQSKSECIIRPFGLPPKASLPELKIAGDKSEGAVELTIAADAPTGLFTIGLQAETKVKYSDNPQALQREQAYLELLKQALGNLGEPAEKPLLEKTIADATARVEALKPKVAEREITIWPYSNQLQLKILAKPTDP